MSQERRTEERVDCNLPARIELADRPPVECLVKDLSDIGAKIAIAADVELPGHFTLIVPEIPGVDQRFAATLRWREGGLVGVAFETRG